MASRRYHTTWPRYRAVERALRQMDRALLGRGAPAAYRTRLKLAAPTV